MKCRRCQAEISFVRAGGRNVPCGAVPIEGTVARGAGATFAAGRAGGYEARSGRWLSLATWTPAVLESKRQLGVPVETIWAPHRCPRRRA